MTLRCVLYVVAALNQALRREPRPRRPTALHTVRMSERSHVPCAGWFGTPLVVRGCVGRLANAETLTHLCCQSFASVPPLTSRVVYVGVNCEWLMDRTRERVNRKTTVHETQTWIDFLFSIRLTFGKQAQTQHTQPVIKMFCYCFLFFILILCLTNILNNE